MFQRLFVITALFTVGLMAQTTETINITVYPVQTIGMTAADVAQGLISNLDAQANKKNAAMLADFGVACQSWTVNNLRYRDMKLPLTLKPTPSPAIHFSALTSGSANGPLAVTLTTLSGPDGVSAPCPDLPNLPSPKANNFVLGAPIASSPGWFAVGEGDTMPGNTVVTAPDGSKYYKVANPFGGWYIAVN